MSFGRILLGLLTGGMSELARKAVKGVAGTSVPVGQALNGNSGSYGDFYSDDFVKEIERLMQSETSDPSSPSFLSRRDVSDVYNMSDGNGLSDLIRGWTGSGLTTAQIQANMFNRSERIAGENFTHNEAVDARLWEQYVSQNKYQWETQSMQNAGVNPAMVYGGGSLVGTHATGAMGSSQPASSVSPGSPGLGLGDLMNGLMALVRMPLEMKALNAEIGQTRANTKLTEQKTETEIQLTRIQSINADYQDAINEQTLDNLKEQYNNMVADTDLKTANKDYVITQKDAQITLNKYIDERQRAEIDQIKANKDKLSADEKYVKAQKVYQDWYNGFVQANGFLPSSNDYLMLGAYICSIFDIDKDDVKRVLEEVMDDFVPGHKRAKASQGRGGSTSPTGGDAPATSGNSR